MDLTYCNRVSEGSNHLDIRRPQVMNWTYTKWILKLFHLHLVNDTVLFVTTLTECCQLNSQFVIVQFHVYTYCIFTLHNYVIINFTSVEICYRLQCAEAFFCSWKVTRIKKRLLSRCNHSNNHMEAEWYMRWPVI